MERSKTTVWSIKWNASLLAVTYTGVVCSGLAYYIQGIVMKTRGPVFVTAFSPLNMVIVAFLSTIILAEQLCLGRVVGAIVIVIGLYFLVWGKRKDYKSSSLEACPSGKEPSNLEVITINTPAESAVSTGKDDHM